MPGEHETQGKAEATEEGHPPRNGDWFEEKAVDPLPKEDQVGACNSDLLLYISHRQPKLLQGRPPMLSELMGLLHEATRRGCAEASPE